MSFTKITCSFCDKQFLRDTKEVKRNLRSKRRILFPQMRRLRKWTMVPRDPKSADRLRGTLRRRADAFAPFRCMLRKTKMQ